MPNAEEVSRAISHITDALRLLGHNTAANPSTEKTPQRIAKFWASVMPVPVLDFDFTTFDAKGTDELVLVRDIEYSSLCEHHFLPFFGKVHVAYLPSERIVGLSKIPRLVDFCSKRPQTQEYLTLEIGKYMEMHLRPRFVAVQIVGTHTCVACRGVRKHGCETLTAYYSPKSQEYETTKQEFLQLLRT